MKFFFHYRFTLIYYYLTLPLIFSYSFRCEEGQKMKKDNLKFSINETSFPDELLLERNNNILHSLRIKILNTKTKTQFNRWTFQYNVILFNYNILTELQKILITLCFFWACTSSPKPQIASETVCITARLISSSSNAFFFFFRVKKIGDIISSTSFVSPSPLIFKRYFPSWFSEMGIIIFFHYHNINHSVQNC